MQQILIFTQAYSERGKLGKGPLVLEIWLKFFLFFLIVYFPVPSPILSTIKWYTHWVFLNDLRKTILAWHNKYYKITIFIKFDQNIVLRWCSVYLYNVPSSNQDSLPPSVFSSHLLAIVIPNSSLLLFLAFI